MDFGMKLGAIPEKNYSDYRYDVIFKAYKWDPQVGDSNTVAKYVVLMNRDTAELLGRLAEQLSEETMQMEEALAQKLYLAKKLGLPNEIKKALTRLSNYDRSRNVRLMRFDFHPTKIGWMISEVNSDVPGGLAEASVLPAVATRYFNGYSPHKNVADSILVAFQHKMKPGGVAAFVHATSYADDRQVMQFLGDTFGQNGYQTLYAAPDHIKWIDKKAVNTIKGLEGNVDSIIRFFPLEWLANLPQKKTWLGHYDCDTVSCNHPISILTQSKRLPLIWDELDVDIPTWKALLPPTVDPKHMHRQADDWILKPALGRVGEGISIKGAASENECKLIEKAVRKRPQNWVAQQMFHSQPLTTENGEDYHLCIGVFTVDGKSAGFYGRMNPYPHIDARAKDIPVLVLDEEDSNHAG